MSKKINVSMELEEQTLENIFVTAIEGGSCYWFEVSKKSLDEIMEVDQEIGKPFSLRLFNAVYHHGVKVTVVDAENAKERIGVLDVDKFEDRLNKCFKEAPDAIMSEINEAGDAETSDIVFQYLALNDLIYG